MGDNKRTKAFLFSSCIMCSMYLIMSVRAQANILNYAEEVHFNNSVFANTTAEANGSNGTFSASFFDYNLLNTPHYLNKDNMAAHKHQNSDLLFYYLMSDRIENINNLREPSDPVTLNTPKNEANNRINSSLPVSLKLLFTLIIGILGLRALNSIRH